MGSGNADGLGSQRSEELRDCCKNVLGIDSGNIEIVDDQRLPDGMNAKWPASHISEHIRRYVNKFSSEKEGIKAVSEVKLLDLYPVAVST